MEMYILRAYKPEFYKTDGDDDNYIESYRDIEFSLFRDKLQGKADELNRGIMGDWTEGQQEKLRALDSQYDCFDDVTYRVETVTLEIK